MIGLVILLFVVCFATILMVFGFSTKYFQAKQKEQIRSMLRKAEEAPIKGSGSAIRTADLLRPDSSGEGFAKLLSHFAVIEKLDAVIEQSGQNTNSTKLLITCLIAGGIGFVLGQRFSFILTREITAGVIAALASTLPFYNMLRVRQKRFDQFEQQLPEALDFISRSMRAGHGFTIALEMLAADSPDPLGAAFRKIANDMQLGGSLPVCLSKLLELFPLVDVRFFVSSVLLQQETGGNLGEILSKLATIIRERFRLKGQVKAASAHGRITGLVLVLMPVAVACFMMVTSPDYLTDMAADKTGRIMIYGAVMGQIIGYFVIKKIINIKV
jgi:tight adherence protein B